MHFRIFVLAAEIPQRFYSVPTDLDDPSTREKQTLSLNIVLEAIESSTSAFGCDRASRSGK